MNTKLCLNCKTVKPLEEMRVDKRKKDGHAAWCYECFNALRRKRRKDGQYSEYERSYADMRYIGRPRAKVFKRDYYQCTRCSSSYKLLVHHKDDSGVGRGETDFSKVNNNLDNLETICRSCHNKIHVRR